MRALLPLVVAVSGCTSTAPTTPQRVVVPKGPLPDPIDLHAVDLAMTIDPRTEDFSGSIDLHIHLGNDRQVLWMHGQDLHISTVEARPSSGAPVSAQWTPRGETGVARVVFEEELPAGDYSLHLEWTGRFATDLAGLFKVEERGQTFALAKSESIQARRALPGFDEPRFKAPYRVELTVPEGFAVIGNGPEVERLAVGNGMERVRLAETAPLPTYLLSLAVGPFESIDGPPIPPGPGRADPIPLRGHARQGRAKDLGVLLAATPPIIAILEDAFGLPFPDSKLDIVAAPAWPSGATELAAAITYREERVLLGERDDRTIDATARQQMLSTHAHELVHMWFGNMVTPAWWNDLWLKEGFATWGSALALARWEPDGGHDLHAVRRKLSAFASDSLQTARAVREPIRGDADIRNAYDSITYGKGMAVLEMVDQGFGPDIFRSAVRQWLEETAGQSTDTETFIRKVVQASGRRDLGSAFTTFLDQPGVPLVSVTPDCPNGAPPALTLRQERYRPKGSRIRDRKLWTIPICLAVDTLDTPVCTVLDTKDKQLTLPEGACPRVVRPNPGGHGYFRFGLSTAGWNDLARVLPNLSAAEAWMVVDSASAGFAAEKVPAPTLLKIYEAAARHPSRYVATAPLDTIQGWKRHLEPATLDQVRAWASRTWTPLRTAAARSSNADSQLLAMDILKFEAEFLEDDHARTALAGRLTRRAAGDSTALPSSVVDAAARVVAEDQGAEALATLTEAVVRLDEPSLERAVLSAVGHLKDPNQRLAAFEATLANPPDPRVVYARIEAFMSTPNASRRTDIRQVLERDWVQVSESIPRQWRRSLPLLWAGAACSRAEAQALEAWFSTDAADVAPGYARPLSQTIERIELCAAKGWMEPAVASAFR